MNLRKIAIVTTAFVLALAFVPQAQAQNGPSEENSAKQQKELLRTYGLKDNQKPCLKIDSKMSRNEALGDSVVPTEYKDLHAKMKPYLTVVPVLYHGFDDCTHIGQIVVHRDLVGDTMKLFVGMYKIHFPIKSVIPASKFNYVDRDSMLANNTSNYRPERLGSGNLSEHAKGAAFDINPFTNPFMIYDESGELVFVDPPGAMYDPAAKGALYKDSPVRKMWTALDYEWGGNWGDPNADPPTDFFEEGYFDYQHFQLNFRRYDKLPLPSDI